MKTFFNIILITLLSGQVPAQTFKQHKKTSFYFFSADKKINGQNNSYVKKGDSILILNKEKLSDFLALFEQAPQSFDSLFKILPWLNNKAALSDKRDPILKATKYRISSNIELTSVSKTDNSVIWNITNSDYVSANPTCYLTILFKNTEDNLIFDKINREYCDY